MCQYPPPSWQNVNKLIYQKHLSPLQTVWKMISVWVHREAEMGAQESCNRLLHSMVFLCCFLFTFYQSYMCLLKYLSYPRGTSTEYKPPNMFPAITICSRYSERELYFPFKIDKLKECNIGRQTDKRYLSKNHYHNSSILVIRIWLETQKSVGDRWNCLDNDVLMTGTKPLPSLAFN